MPPRWQGRRTTSSRAIFLFLCTGLLLTRRGRLPTRRQKLDQSLGDGQAVRWAAVDRWATERASARAPQPPRPSGYATLSGDGSSGGPDRRCLTGLLPLDGSEHPVPGLRLRGLSGERRRTGILPRHGSGLPPVHIDHVAGEIQIVGIIDHYGCLVDYRVERWRRKWQGRSPLPPYGEAMPFPPRLGSSSTLVIHAVRRRDRCTLGLRPVPPGEGCVVARQGQLSTLHRHSRGTTLIGKLRCGSSAPLPLGESTGAPSREGANGAEGCLDALDRDGTEPASAAREHDDVDAQVTTLAASCFCPGSARKPGCRMMGSEGPVVQAADRSTPPSRSTNANRRFGERHVKPGESTHRRPSKSAG